MLSKIGRAIDILTEFVGLFCAFLVVALAVNIFYDVIARYFFSSSTIFTQELQWHIFSAIFLLAMGYALKHEAHVRVDIFYEKFNPKTKAIINIIGTLMFILPLSGLIIYTSIDFVQYAYSINEKSPDPGGIPYRFIIKSLIPIAFIFLILQCISFLIKNINSLLNLKG